MRRRSGRHSPVSMHGAEQRGQTPSPTMRRRDHVRDRSRRLKHPGHERAERDHLAVGEVGQAGRAEDQRQADRRDGDDHRQLETVGEGLREQAPLALHLAGVLAEEEHSSHVLVGGDLGRLALFALLHLEPLREGVDVEHDDVAAWFGNRDLVRALVGGHRFPDHLAVGALDRDPDVRHRLGDPLAVFEKAVLDTAGDSLVGLLLGAGDPAADRGEPNGRQHAKQQSLRPTRPLCHRVPPRMATHTSRGPSS